MESTKQGIWVFYGILVAAMVLGSGWIATLGRVLLFGTLAIHVVEFVVKRSLFERVGGSMGHHFVQTLIYGLFHWKPLEDGLAGEDA